MQLSFYDAACSLMHRERQDLAGIAKLGWKQHSMQYCSVDLVRHHSNHQQWDTKAEQVSAEQGMLGHANCEGPCRSK